VRGGRREADKGVGHTRPIGEEETRTRRRRGEEEKMEEGRKKRERERERQIGIVECTAKKGKAENS
jgi:hypothetical protein